jgi:site-specific recombinase XerC
MRQDTCGDSSPAAAGLGPVATDPGRPLAQFLAPRLAPKVADELAGHELEEDLGLAVAAAAASMAANTRRGYGNDLADFQAYCAEHQVPGLPAAPAVIAAYLAIRAFREPRLSLASLARRLAAIRKLHDLNGYRGQANPGRQPDVQRAWAGIRRQRTWTQQQVPEAGADQVRAMVAACPLDRYIGLRDRALLLLHYVLGTRRSELVALDVEDLVLVDQGLVAIVWRRKTDQERRDLDLVAVPYLQQPATCPVRAWLAWQEAAGLESGPAFRPVHPGPARLAGRIDDPGPAAGRPPAAGREGQPGAQAAGRPGGPGRPRPLLQPLDPPGLRGRVGSPWRQRPGDRRRWPLAAPGAGAPLRQVGGALGRSPGVPAGAALTPAGAAGGPWLTWCPEPVTDARAEGGTW